MESRPHSSCWLFVLATGDWQLATALSLHRNAFLQFLKPVQDDVDFARSFLHRRFVAGLRGLQQEETLAVRTDIPVANHAAANDNAIRSLKQSFWCFKAEGWLGFYRNPHKRISVPIEQFPAVPASYFDVETGKYVTLQSEPIPVEVAKADRLSRSQILAAPGGPSARGRELEVRQEGLFATITDPSAVYDQSVRPGVWLLGLGGLAGVYAMIAVGTLWFRRVSDDQALVRRRGAPAKARSRLREGIASLESQHVQEGSERIRAALVGLVADAANMPEAGATPKDICRQLDSFGVERDLITRVGRSLETCEATRYAGATASVNGLGEEAGDVLEEMIRSLKRQKRFR